MNYDIPDYIKILDENSKGSISFLIDIYSDPDNLSTTGFVNLHSHPEIQICYVTKGCVEFTVEKDKYIAHQGDAIFINSYQTHMAREGLGKGKDSTYICYNIKPDYFYPFFDRIDSHYYIKYFLQNGEISAFLIDKSFGGYEETIELLKEIYRIYLEEGFAYEFQVAAKLIRLWYLIICEKKEWLEENEKNRELPLEQLRMKQVQDYVAEHYAEKITLSDVSELLHISKEEVCRLFKRMLNTTCMKYITEYRIIKSVDSLCYTNRSIGEIATACGFRKFSTFTKNFTQYVGCTPSEYRKKYVNKN